MRLKNFSSGMCLRLVFSTAIQANPDTLLIDEVFAVGDEAFRKKSSSKINELKEQSKTIIFVSHSLETIKSLCQKCQLPENGRIVSMGSTEGLINDYLAMLQGGCSNA